MKFTVGNVPNSLKSAPIEFTSLQFRLMSRSKEGNQLWTRGFVGKRRSLAVDIGNAGLGVFRPGLPELADPLEHDVENGREEDR
jgi:hypothetical protein